MTKLVEQEAQLLAVAVIADRTTCSSTTVRLRLKKLGLLRDFYFNAITV